MTRQQRIEFIHKIQSYSEPPLIEGDMYYQREPWPKLGGMDCSSIFVRWRWYTDDVILQKASDEELRLAMTELKNNKDNIEMAQKACEEGMRRLMENHPWIKGEDGSVIIFEGKK